jgi:DNA-directed RNA polymerase subunit M/transcription elongation factor TFIIS
VGTGETVTTYRCTACGNKTRFDVYDTVRRKRFEHADLAGVVAIEEEVIVERTVDRVVCRWCDRSDAIEEIQTDR